MKMLLVLGTRPEIIKCSPIIRKCERLSLDYSILHTGQHYSYDMDKVFFENLELQDPKYKLDTGSGCHGAQTGKMLIGIEKVLKKEKPDVVLVQGDTNTALAGALAAAKLHIKVGHVEAGLRSFDQTMPEEVNRVLVDHCSDYLFAPTELSKRNLLNEGIPEKRVHVVGNTIVDVITQNLNVSKYKINVLKELNLTPDNYFLVTIHRQENVDNGKKFKDVIDGLTKVSDEFGLPLIYPIHPRSKKQMEKFNLKQKTIRFIDPIDFLSFLQLESNAKLVLTDSGGVQEETCILGVACVTLRDNTERQETLEVGCNILAGTNPDKILECTKIMVTTKKGWKNPFGDGNSGKKIVEKLLGSQL